MPDPEIEPLAAFDVESFSREVIREASRVGVQIGNHAKSLRGFKRLAALRPDEQCQVVAALTGWLIAQDRIADEVRMSGDHTGWQEVWIPRFNVSQVLSKTLLRSLPLGETLVSALIDWIHQGSVVAAMYYPLTQTVQAVERIASQRGISESFRPSVERFRQVVENRCHDNNADKLANRLRQLLGKKSELALRRGEPWTDRALDVIGNSESGVQTAWTNLIEICRQSNGSTPTRKWFASAKEQLELLGNENFRKHILDWLALAERADGQPLAPARINQINADILKGLVWCCGLSDDAQTARVVTALALSCFRKIPGYGPRAAKVGNACIYALGSMPGNQAVGRLAMLKVKLKPANAQKAIAKAMQAVAVREGISPEELEELAVPTYGLNEVGLRRDTVGEFTAELRVTADSAVELQWLNADAKRQKSVPSSIKLSHSDGIKELKNTVKDIKSMLPAQKERLDSLFLHRKSWPYATWRERYLDHPLLGVLARRLIWRFTFDGAIADGIYWNGQLVGHDDRGLGEWLGTSTVTLWHPISEATETVIAWRAWCQWHEVRQPFKQAHREVYLLTDAERSTSIYSNRFAAHILKQHQFHALATARGWKNSLSLMVDSDFPPATKPLPEWGLRAEFWVEGAGDETNESGTYLYVSTDQVRFYAADSNDPTSLDQIPPLVFSETMRDVDLFVGVASVGNDPTWQDGGTYVEYWQQFAFGELTATAQTRKAVLQQLIPRLKIADRCTFADRFLVVRGELRTYKIHLGSGNILMEPNDQYLCIVPKQTPNPRDQIFLPFDGDQILSTILSKAFLLAADSKITDSTITSQIGRN